MINRDWFNSPNFNPANYVVSTLLMYLRAMYAHNSDLGFEIWDEEAQDQVTNLSRLLIEDKQTWDHTHRGHLPSIIVQRQTVSFGGGIQDGGQSRILQAGFDLETSVMEIVSIPVIISVVARQDLESEALAFLTKQFLWDNKNWMKAFKIFGMTSPQISDVKIYNASENGFITNIFTSFSIQVNYTLHSLPHNVLQQLALKINNQQTNLNVEN